MAEKAWSPALGKAVAVGKGGVGKGGRVNKAKASVNILNRETKKLMAKGATEKQAKKAALKWATGASKALAAKRAKKK